MEVLTQMDNSNRTFMELKWTKYEGKLSKIENSNRTFMELKLQYGTYSKHKRKTPIAPLWNWNSKPKIAMPAIATLQSHLYGIEMMKLLKSGSVLA